jgi:hypothetical protein
MPFVDTGKLEVFEKGIGWRGRAFHSPSMTFCHWEFENGASVHEHSDLSVGRRLAKEDSANNFRL